MNIVIATTRGTRLNKSINFFRVNLFQLLHRRFLFDILLFVDVRACLDFMSCRRVSSLYCLFIGVRLACSPDLFSVYWPLRQRRGNCKVIVWAAPDQQAIITDAASITSLYSYYLSCSLRLPMTAWTQKSLMTVSRLRSSLQCNPLRETTSILPIFHDLLISLRNISLRISSSSE